MEWLVSDGKDVLGPVSEEHVLGMIGNGLPATVLVKPEGTEEWKSLRTHAPFAMALNQREAEAPPPAPPRPPPPAPQRARVPTPPAAPFYTSWWGLTRGEAQGLGAAVIAALTFMIIAMVWSSKPKPTVSAEVPTTAPPVVVSTSPAAFPARVPAGTWATIPMPGYELPNTSDARTDYFLHVLQAVPGEPPVKKKAGLALMAKLRATIAKQFNVSMSAIKVDVGDASASIVADRGALAGINARGTDKRFGVCSEAVLVSSMIIASTTQEEFAEAGVRAIMCKSDGCTSIMDLRPTARGQGIYAGDLCVDMDEFVRLGIGK